MFRSIIFAMAMLSGHVIAEELVPLDDSNILAASREWMSNPEEAEIKYGHISKWDTSDVTDMSWLFVNGPYQNGYFTVDGESHFNEDISSWDTSKVKDMSAMFYYCTKFDQDLSKWDTSKVTSLSSTFEQARQFKGTGLEGWDTGSVKQLDSAFQHAHAFDADISKWNTSSVNSMIGTFSGTKSFNADISNWDVSSVRDMVQAFDHAAAFNVDLNKWKVSNVERMVNTFYKAKRFDQELCWDLHPDVYLVDTFCGSKSSFDPECVPREQRKESTKGCPWQSWTRREIACNMISLVVLFLIVAYCMKVILFTLTGKYIETLPAIEHNDDNNEVPKDDVTVAETTEVDVEDIEDIEN